MSARRDGDAWKVTLADGSKLTAGILVNAAGAWADSVAASCGAARLGIAPKRRTMVQLRVGETGLKDLPLVNDSEGNFYFKGEGDGSIWLSPHDEVETEPCDAAPEEIDIATAIDQFEGVVDWPIERIERSWAGLGVLRRTASPSTDSIQKCPTSFGVRGRAASGSRRRPRLASSPLPLSLMNSPIPASPTSVRAIFHPHNSGRQMGEAGVSLPPPAFNEQGERRSR